MADPTRDKVDRKTCAMLTGDWAGPAWAQRFEPAGSSDNICNLCEVLVEKMGTWSSSRPYSLAATVGSVAVLCFATIVWFGSERASELVAISIAPNNLLNVDVPVSQLSTTKVGDIVQGQVTTGLGLVSWKGAITAGTTISPTQGCVTVKIISDKYIAPGTPVSGSVGNAAFAGTVVGSPNHQERMGNIERRLKALEPDNKEEVGTRYMQVCLT